MGKRKEFCISIRLYVKTMKPKDADKIAADISKMLQDRMTGDFRMRMAFTGQHVEVESLEEYL